VVESGRLKPLVDRTYPLEHIADAQEYCESGRVRGKIVIDDVVTTRLRNPFSRLVKPS
jgi:D-arabinose 1-dehydrogenase-like Zn-dependent alcohol dehydrogenase